MEGCELRVLTEADDSLSLFKDGLEFFLLNRPISWYYFWMPSFYISVFILSYQLPFFSSPRVSGVAAGGFKVSIASSGPGRYRRANLLHSPPEL